jgi:plasmid stabilization system protein ParE
MKKYSVVLTPQAEHDIDRAKAWEAQHDASWPDAIDDAIDGVSLLLSRFPELGSRVEINGVYSETLRSWPVGASGYLFRYRVEHSRERIILLRFRHEARRPLKR